MKKQTAEEILREYVEFNDVNQSNTIELLPLTIVDAMEEYATQCQEDNDWTKVCECENSIGQTWCCNQCGLPYDTRKSDKIYTEEDLHTILRLRKEWYSHTDKNVVRDFIKIKQDK